MVVLKRTNSIIIVEYSIQIVRFLYCLFHLVCCISIIDKHITSVLPMFGVPLRFSAIM